MKNALWTAALTGHGDPGGEDEAWRLDKESWNQDNSVVRQPLSGKAEAPQVTKMRAKFP